MDSAGDAAPGRIEDGMADCAREARVVGGLKDFLWGTAAEALEGGIIICIACESKV